jgi:iron(III) transport system substrate-binding protein
MNVKNLLAAVFALALCCGAAWSAAANSEAALIKQAAAAHGGKVIMYNALFQPLNDRIMAAFNKKYAKDGISIEIEKAQSGRQAALYDQELRANKVDFDLLFLVDPGIFLHDAEEHKFTPYCSNNFKDFRAAALSPDCSYFTATAYYQYIAYNTDLMKGKDIPNSWNDLLNPKWKGKIGLPDPRVGGGFYYFVFTIYKLFGPSWFVKARANDPQLVQSHAVTENEVMSGQLDMGVDISVLTRADGPYPGGKGAPIREAFPKEGGALLQGDMGITRGGPNPAGAKLFIDWAASLAGQKVINQHGGFSLRKDFTSVEGDDLSKIAYHLWNPKEMDEHRDKWTAESYHLLTGQ